jgi:hypothetical protein
MVLNIKPNHENKLLLGSHLKITTKMEEVNNVASNNKRPRKKKCNFICRNSENNSNENIDITKDKHTI